MSNIVELPDQQTRTDQACEWLARLDQYDDASDGLSLQDESALQQWMAVAPENQAVLFELIELWDKMDSLSRLSDLFDKNDHFQKEQKSQQGAYGVAKNSIAQNHSPQSRPFLAVAASFLLVALIGLAYWLPAWRGDYSDQLVATADNTYQTAIGEYSTVTLSDGSQLLLNTHTLVNVEYTDSYRLIRLVRGELHVSVAKDTERPLSVIAGNKIVQAVGTEFNVEITHDQAIELIVTEGIVKVGVHKASLAQNDTFETLSVNKRSVQGLPDSSVTVSAGEGLMLGTEKEKIQAEKINEVTPADIEVKLSWQKGNLIFRGESLEEAVKEVARYASVEFIFMDEGLKGLRVAGLFKAGDVEGLLATLRENFNIVSQRVNGKKVLLSEEAPLINGAK